MAPSLPSSITIGWLASGDHTLPSVRFRVLPLVQKACQQKYQAAVLRLPKTLSKRIAFYLKLPQKNIYIIQKRMLSALEIFLIKRRCQLVVYDFDDAVWTEQADPQPIETGQKKTTFLANASRVDTIIAGNKYLASALPAQSKRIIMPTPIDIDYYSPPARTLSDSPQIGWMGTSSYLPYICPIFEKLTHLGLPMLIVSNKQPTVQPSSIHFSFWSDEQEKKLLQSFDIGLMPLEDTPYTLGKCGFKILQYMACGVVPIASAVGMNCDIIEHGKTGFLVEPEESWEPYIQQLLDPQVRATMAQAARTAVCNRFSVASVTQALLTQLHAHYLEKIK